MLNKWPAGIEVASDLDPELMAFYRVLRDRTEELMAIVSRLSYDRETFEQACGSDLPADPLLSAVWFLVRNRFSRVDSGKTSLGQTDFAEGGRAT